MSNPSIEEFYEENVVDESFDEIFYASINKEVKDFYQPYCSDNNITERQRLFYHYYFFGKYYGAKKRKGHCIPKNPKEISEIPLCKKEIPTGLSLPKISIVVPNYNYGKFLEENLLSIISQNYPNKEIIVVDGDSTDNSKKIINKYKNHIDKLICEKDSGQSNAINKGFKIADGSILSWLNSDDSLCDNALLAVGLTFIQNNVDIIAGICNVYQEDYILYQSMSPYDKDTLCLNDLLDLDNQWMKGKFFFQPEVFFSKNIYEKIGSEVNEKLYWSMDYDLWCRLSEHNPKIKIISHQIANHRKHDEQKTSELKFIKELYSHRDLLSKQHDIKIPEKETKDFKYLQIAAFNDVGFECGAGIAHKTFCQCFQMGGHNVHTLQGTTNIGFHRQQFDYNKAIQSIESIDPDFIFCSNLHSLENDLTFLEDIVEKYPTVFMMHDQWLITGKCPYTKHCKQYLTECTSSCPDLRNYPVLHKSKINSHFHRKRKLLNNNNLTIFCNSNYLTNFVRNTTGLTENKVHCVQPSIDTDIFKPYDKILCREKFDLPKDKFIILIGATDLNEQRKGVNDSVRAINETNIDNCMVVTFGNGFSPIDIKYDSVNLGFINDRYSMAHLYCACDLFVGPSLQEAFGMVFAESSSCGTPCIGYASDGVNESICNGITGLTVPKNNIADLTQAIQRIHDDLDLRNNLAFSAPFYIQNHFSFHATYKQIIKGLNKSNIISEIQLRNQFINPKETKWLDHIS